MRLIIFTFVAFIFTNLTLSQEIDQQTLLRLNKAKESKLKIKNLKIELDNFEKILAPLITNLENIEDDIYVGDKSEEDKSLLLNKIRLIQNKRLAILLKLIAEHDRYIKRLEILTTVDNIEISEMSQVWLNAAREDKKEDDDVLIFLRDIIKKLDSL